MLSLGPASLGHFARELSVRKRLPRGCIFSVRGYALIAPLADLTALLGFLSAAVFDYLFKMCPWQSGAHPEFVVGTLQRLPVPELGTSVRSVLVESTKRAIEIRRRPPAIDEVNMRIQSSGSE